MTRQRHLRLLLLILALAPGLTAAWDEELIEACRAVAAGRATPQQQALVVYHNKAVNQMALGNHIPDDVYQASQALFDRTTRPMIEQAANEAGLKARLQASSGTRYNPGTDTDIIVERGADGRMIDLPRIQQTEAAYQRQLRQYLNERGVKPPSGKINTDTDFMPSRSSTTAGEFTRINTYINQNGGTAYERPGAAEVERQLRLGKDDIGRTLDYRDTGEYVSEMRRLARDKLAHAAEWEAQARSADPVRAQALEADAQLARSQASKYLQRIDKVSNTLAEQNGVAGVGRSTDSLGQAMRDIDQGGRGIATQAAAGRVGELGELGIGKGLKDYVEVLSRIAARNPEESATLRGIIAEQAGDLSPGLRDTLIARARAAFREAGGSRLRAEEFARELARSAAGRSGPRTPAATGPADPGGTARTRPAGAAPGGQGVSAARLAGGVGGGLTAVTLAVDYQACIDEGRPEAECARDLALAAGGMATAGGVIGVSASTLAALGVSATAIATVQAALVGAGLPLAIYGAYVAGERWANAPEVAANERLREEEKNLLMGFERMVEQAQAGFAQLQAMGAEADTLCRQVAEQGRTLQDNEDEARELARRLQASLDAVQRRAALCEEVRGLAADLDTLRRKAGADEARVIGNLDEAVALAARCNSRADAERIAHLYAEARAVAARLQVDAARVKGSRAHLVDIAGLPGDLQAAGTLRDELGSRHQALARQTAAINDSRERFRTLQERYAGKRAEVARRVARISALLPRQSPSPLYQREYLTANAREAQLQDALAQAPESPACDFGAFGHGEAVRLKLEAERRFEKLDETYRSVRDQAKDCPDGAAGAQDAIAAAANWALAAVTMNDSLPRQAEACMALAGSAAAAAGTPAAASLAEDLVFEQPLYLFRLLDDQDPKRASFIFYAKVDGGGGSFRFPDGAGGYYHRKGEVLGQYRGAQDACAVLRGYGAYVADYNLGWAPHVRCNRDGPVSRPAGTGGSASTTPPARPGAREPDARVTGGVAVHLPDGTTRPLAANDQVPHGAIVETGADGRVVLGFAGGTTAVAGPGCRLRVMPSSAGGAQQTLHLLDGGIEVAHPPGRAGSGDLTVQTRDASAVATGTRYKVAVSPRGTTFQVSEGTIRIAGLMLARTDARFEVPGKPSFQRWLDLRAGERAIALNAGAPAPAPAADTSPLARPDPWNDPRVQNLIDEWLRGATPAVAAGRPGSWRYNEWAQILGPGITSTGPPDHPAGWSRHQSLWAVRSRFDSLNLCTLGEFIERRLAGRTLDDCAGSRPGTPAWLPPAATTPPRPAGNKADEAIASARAEVARQTGNAAPATDFAGDWACTVRIGTDTSALFPSITRSAGGYAVETLTSGIQGMVRAHAVRVEGGRLVAEHGFTTGSMTLTLERHAGTLSGTYREQSRDGRSQTGPLNCTIAPAGPAAPPARPAGVTESKKK